MRVHISLLVAALVPMAVLAHEHEHQPDLGNIGKAHLATSCNAAAQKEIDRGVALMERLFGTKGPTSMEMVGDAADAESVQKKLADEFPNVQVKTWKEINRPLFSWRCGSRKW